MKVLAGRVSCRLVVVCAVLSGLAGCESKVEAGAATEPPAKSQAPAKPGDAECPDTFGALPSAGGAADKSCRCGPVATMAKVWGSGIYTAESSLCSAAVHAGAIPLAGGKVTVRQAPGCESYLGSTNNKVTTTPTGRAAESFYFPSVSDGKCGPLSQ